MAVKAIKAVAMYRESQAEMWDRAASEVEEKHGESPDGEVLAELCAQYLGEPGPLAGD